MLEKSNRLEIKDSLSRSFPYLRISITEVCNFFCQYCLPNGYAKSDCKAGFLTLDEIKRVIVAFQELGVWKVRLTGGEPTVREDFVDIVRMISQMRGIRQCSVTTNGLKLKNRTSHLKEAGLKTLNVSIDSLNPKIFYNITGHDRLQKVLDGINEAIDMGFDEVKANVILLKGKNDEEIDDFIAWTKNTPISVRFLELMQTGDNREFFKKHHMSGEIIRRKLLNQGWVEKLRQEGAGPATPFTHPDHCGTIGLISPYAEDFCKSCNRLRVTARGELRLCLFGQGNISMRHLLQEDSQKNELKQFIVEHLSGKLPAHFLHAGETGIANHFASIGG